MRRLSVLLILVLTASLAFADAKTETTERLQNAATVVKEITSAPDKGIPGEVFDAAKCVVVVPHLVKGGFVFGGKHGRGAATCKTASGWSAPAFVSVGGGSWGLQIGVQGVDLVMLIMNEKGAQRLLANKFQVGGEASAAAGPVGRHASAGTDWKADTEILTYSRAKGAFAGATLEGAVVQQDDDSTVAIYGKKIDQKQLLSGSVPTPDVAEAFVSAVKAAAAQSAAH
jgi:lipid-binding SYLF domain-containing protein